MFDYLFPDLNDEFYGRVFFDMVDNNELPLIGVIPLSGSCDHDCQVALDYH